MSFENPDPDILTALVNGASGETIERIRARVDKENAELAERGKVAQAIIDARNERERQANLAKLEAEEREAAATRAEMRLTALKHEAVLAYAAHLAEQDRAKREAWIENYVTSKVAAETK